MAEIEREFVVMDKALGEVSCCSRSDAIDYATRVKGKAWVVEWHRGVELGRQMIWPTSDQHYGIYYS